jgi:hypothetical protein
MVRNVLHSFGHCYVDRDPNVVSQALSELKMTMVHCVLVLHGCLPVVRMSAMAYWESLM